MSETNSPSTGRTYSVTMICETFGAPRSSFYLNRQRGDSEAPGAKKRGPETEHPDEEIVEAIRKELDDPDFSGEGYKKIHARIRYGVGLVVGKNRVLRLMRLEGLLAPVRRRHKRGDKAHEGSIIPKAANLMWGTDGTKFWTEEDGWCWFFGALDHFVGDVVGHNVVKVGNRFAALEPIRQGVRQHIGPFGADVARGLSLRHDWGTQYTADDFQGEIKYLGIQSSPAYVGEPECNGIAERFMRTLREQCLYLHRFKNLDEARQAIHEFIARYNERWLLERHGYRTPNQVRMDSGCTLPEAA